MDRPNLLNRAVLGFLAFGFLILLPEHLHSHHLVLPEEPLSWTPLVFSVIGLLGTVIPAVWWRQNTVKIAAFVGVLSILVGMTGTFLHNRERLGLEEGEETAWTTLIGIDTAYAQEAAPSSEERAAPEERHRHHDHEHDHTVPSQSRPVPDTDSPPTGTITGLAERMHRWLTLKYYGDPRPPLAPLTFAAFGILILAAALLNTRFDRPVPEERDDKIGEG